MTLPRFVLVSGNRDKVAEARRVWPVEIEHVALDLPEIQSLDLDAVLQAKGDEAWRQLGRPLVVEETGLELAALSGFPGPLVKWMLEAVGAVGIARTAITLGDPRATARTRLLYVDGATRTVGEGSANGVLVAEPRGSHGFGWDPIFLPDGERQTYAELDPETKNRIGHRGQAWRALLGAFR